MVKRRRTKLSLGNKAKSNDKEKAVESTNSEETSSKNENILVSQDGRVDGSPLFTKKLKLDSSLSPSANKFKRYVPPFSASIRVSNRLRNRISGQKSEGNSSSQESKILVEGESQDVSKNIKQGNENLQEKRKKETSAMVLKSHEGKADEMSTNISVRTVRSDVQMKVESMKEKDAERDRRKDIASKNVSEITQKQTEDATQQEIGDQGGQENLQQVSKCSHLTQQSCDKIKINGRKEEKERMAKNMNDNKSESLKESMENNVETSGVIFGQMTDVTPLSTIETPMDDFDALGLQTLADTCAVISAVEHVVAIVEEPGKCSQNNVQNKPETKGMHRERRDHKNENNTSSNDIDGKKAQKDVMAVLNESMGKSSFTSSQEIIKDKLSEILSMVAENELSQMKSKRCTNATTMTENADKDGHCKDDPCKANVTDAGILSTEREKSKRDALQERVSVMTDAENGSPGKSEPRKDDPNCEANGTDTKILTTESYKCKPDGLQERISVMMDAENDSPGKSEPCKDDRNCEANGTDTEVLTTESDKCKLDGLQERVSVMMDAENDSPGKSKARKDDPNCEANGTDTEVLTTESDKCKPDGLQERVSNGLVHRDKKSRESAETGNIECEIMSADDSAIIEKEEDAEIKQVSAHVHCDKNVQKATVEGTCNKGFSQEASERIEDFFSKATINDRDVPDKVATSPEQEVPEKMEKSPPSRKEKDVSIILKKNNTETCNHDEVQSSILTSNKNSTTVISHNESKKVETIEEKVDIRTPSNTIDEESYTEEFRELEELLPRDDMGLFDDVMMNKPINVNNDLRCADSTVEFLINEINSLHCMVANYERVVEDMKRQQYKSRF